MKKLFINRFTALHQKLTSESEILNKIYSQKPDSETKVITFVNPYSFFKLIVSDIDISKIDYIGVDAISLVFWLRLFGFKLTRSSMDNSSLFGPLLKAADTVAIKFCVWLDHRSRETCRKELEFDSSKDAVIRVETGYFGSAIPDDYSAAIVDSKYVVVRSVLQEKLSIKLKDS